MPVNEILAASYIITRYHVLPNIQHVFRLYLNTVPTLDGDDGFLYSTYTDAEHTGGYHVRDILQEVLERVGVNSSNSSTKTIDEVEVWRSEDGDNIFMGLDAADYTGIDTSIGSPVASAYTLFNFKSALLFPFRLTFFDTPDSKPQRTPLSPPPATDDGLLAWFMCRSAVGFVTNDGYELATMATVNTGYNRKLARNYGRRIAP